jgi:hypothetical protein
MKQALAVPANHPHLVAQALIRELNSASVQLRELLQRVELHIEDQHLHATGAEDVDEMQRLDDAKPFDWHAQAKHALQSGLMFAIRAVEQPGAF